MLSILIPTYNYDCTPLVKELVKEISIIAIPIEILVCDDASTDLLSKKATQDYCSNNKPHYIENAINLGRTATRNILAQKAIHPWVLFLDADVYPKSSKFITDYIATIAGKNDIHCVFGGITYKEEKPEQDKLLRWKYGRIKESKTVSERNKNPHFIISQNLLIRKELFLGLNVFTQNMYGLDIIFSNELKRKKTEVLHIDNNVYHLGLEPNAVFLHKSIQALKTTIDFEKQEKIPDDLRPVQRIYKRLYLFLGSHKLVGAFLGLFEKKMNANLKGKNPSIIIFDLYRLHQYIKLKSHA